MGINTIEIKSNKEGNFIKKTYIDYGRTKFIKLCSSINALNLYISKSKNDLEYTGGDHIYFSINNNITYYHYGNNDDQFGTLTGEVYHLLDLMIKQIPEETYKELWKVEKVSNKTSFNDEKKAFHKTLNYICKFKDSIIKSNKKTFSIASIIIFTIIFGILLSYYNHYQHNKQKLLLIKEKEQKRNSIISSIEMILVNGDNFIMGRSEYSGWDPAHKVTLNDYYIGKTEVTQALWKAVMGYNPSEFKGDNLPVETVDWNEVHMFLDSLNNIIGKKYRLPTEAEWEYAALGGNKSKGTDYSGSKNIEEVAWYERNSGNRTHPVGEKRANELGIYDMSGNVNEWCSDWYTAYPIEHQYNPQGGTKDPLERHIIRSGAWNHPEGSCEIKDRTEGGDKFKKRNSLGFRLALSKY